MASKSFQWVMGVLLFGVAVTPAVFLGLEHTQLKRRLARQRESTQHTRQLAEENRALQDLVAKTSGENGAAIAGVHADLEAARREVGELEQRAHTQRAAVLTQTASDTAALDSNRDPLLGLTRLEYFTNAGQATPAAAFQTLGWAVLKKPERVAALLTLSPEARAKAENYIASLPAEAQAKWTPEKLAELWVSAALTSVSAIQIANVKMEAVDRATLSFRAPNVRDEPKLKMALGADGWRVLIEERAIDVIRKKVGQAGDAR